MNRLPELVSKIEDEFPGRAVVEVSDIAALADEMAVYFEPVDPAAATVSVRFSCGNYSISYADAIASDSNEHVTDDEAFDWALDQVRRVARFGLVFVTTGWFFHLLRGSEYVIPTTPVASAAFNEELRRRVRPVVQRTWAAW